MDDSIKMLEEALVSRMPNNADKLRASINALDEGMRDFLSRYIKHSQTSSMSVDDLADSYIFLVKETMKEQLRFKRSGRYRFSKYSEVNDMVYDDEEYMRKYMAGLALSTALWENHTLIYKFFKDIISSLECHEGCAKYLEVGAGHGLFAYEALKSEKFSSAMIVDISVTSINMCRDMMQQYDGNAEISFLCTDFLNMEDELFDFISIGEVLEHVENPVAFMEKAVSLMSSGGRIYVSTCLNAPEPDHIYLFERMKDIDDIFLSVGLKSERRLILPSPNATLEECEHEKLPINVAFLLTK